MSKTVVKKEESGSDKITKIAIKKEDQSKNQPPSKLVVRDKV